MKHLATFLTIILFSQYGNAQQNEGSSYDTLWKKVTQLEEENLPKSALEVVRTISQKAIRERNPSQKIKALLYASKYALILEEDAQLHIVSDFQKEIISARPPIKNLLQSYLASMYWQYFQQHRYRIYERTKTAEKVDRTDFMTWDLNTLFQEITTLYESSMDNPEILKRTDLKEFDKILDKQKGSENYRPSVYDLLAHTALEFYRSAENNIPSPPQKFQLDDPEYLCPAPNFVDLRFSTADTASLQLRALKTYQGLLGFHIADPTPEALVEVDLDRLAYVHQNATFQNADSLFLEALQNGVSRFAGKEVSTLYKFEMAKLFQKWSNSYQPGTNGKYQWKRKEALEICNSIITEYPNSRAAGKSKVLKAELLEKSLQLQTQANVPLNAPSLMLARYKNCSQLRFSAYPISPDQQLELEKLYPIEKQKRFLSQLKKEKEWETSLTEVGDLQEHTMELLVPALPNGNYALLAEDGDTFAIGRMQVTNIALSEIRGPKEQWFQVINRNNGEALIGAKANISYKLGYSGPTEQKALVTDSLGMIKIPLTEAQWTDISISITYKGDRAFFGKYYVGTVHQGPEAAEKTFSSFLFTDRSIYRPGQPIYFKGIIIERGESASKTVEGQMVTATLKDINGQEVEKQAFRTNGYGSFSGQFTLPGSLATGQFSIHLQAQDKTLDSDTFISVEEYKRPKFETSIQSPTESYRVNDSIYLKGSANAFAGGAISNAKVSYRVRRTVYYPGWFYWSRPYVPQTSQEIAHGSTITDNSGNYAIAFKALPDQTSPREDLPIFQYEITAEVTDINGETRTANSIVKVGYHALLATLHLPSTLERDSADLAISLSTTNLNGEAVPAKGSVKMYKLVPPKQVLRKRPWEAPQYNAMDKEGFKKLFPHEAFGQEDEITKWEKGQMVWESEFNTETSSDLKLDPKDRWPSGNYVMELVTHDKFGQEVKDVAYTKLDGKHDVAVPDNQLFDIGTDKDKYEPGDTAVVTLSSAAQNITVTLYVERDKNVVSAQTLLLNNDKHSVEIPVGEGDLGGFSVGYSLSAYNGFVSGTLPINVPSPKKDLVLETVTFRNKMTPGAKEKWQFKIKGPKGEKVAAELLAGMYDASLDAFKPHSWYFDPNYRAPYYPNIYINAHQSYGIAHFDSFNPVERTTFDPQNYDRLNWFGFSFWDNYGPIRIRGISSKPGPAAYGSLQEEALMEKSVNAVSDMSTTGPEENLEGFGVGDVPPSPEMEGAVQVRKNLKETAFFFPQLQTDADGNVTFDFTAPEALTRWKLQLLAHTKSLESVLSTRESITQKELMIVPNAPRFLRIGDTISISAKISNLTENQLSGKAYLLLEDAVTGKEITAQLIKDLGRDGNDFTIDAKGSSQVTWTFGIPDGIQAVQYTVTATAGNFSDGEQNLLPVLSNRQLVTETLPMWVRNNGSKSFLLKKLRDNVSPTLKNHKLTLEITSNPAWYAVQALPYLMEYPYECSEQTFARYYANSLAAHIATSNPEIQKVFSQWANSDALIGNLEKNSDLRSLIIQETPWLRDAQSETEQKKRIGLLFDLNQMKNGRSAAINKLKDQQLYSGAWPWFAGGMPNRFITQHILAGLGHLDRLAVTATDVEMKDMTEKALQFADSEFILEYEEMKNGKANMDNDHLSPTQIHYLYMRSFYDNVSTSKKIMDIKAYYKKQAGKYWHGKNLQSQAMIALFLHREGDGALAEKILRSLTENSITNDEMGMYWKSNSGSWHWNGAAVETQALLIETFAEVAPEGPEKDATVDNLKIWLLKNKQTNQWKTTKATSEAVYALLLRGSDWLSVTDAVQVMIGGKAVDKSKLDEVSVEAGTGYYKTAWMGSEIRPEMAEVQLEKKGNGVAWGALYWQYFEDLDKITTAASPLSISKKMFLLNITETGEEITEIKNGTALNVGDLVRVRMELRTDRAMEFIHLKDMRASGLEPVNVLSQYKWQDGLGYYESTKDAATNFFFDLLPKGTYVFEYDLRVNNAGNFSNGITTVQSMYAPEFGSHSEGSRIEVGKQKKLTGKR
tara:strand:- start:88089 stop:94160 length:6072 start_codon:yes stop_codon:yes gene_type:complete